ncbi:MAG: ribonucleoside triphosphate reductase, partial [Desulfobacteraceae bacterium]|nr:ribonucleoside triphosphate reductase [Desulfobacteraceae bacterium]
MAALPAQSIDERTRTSSTAASLLPAPVFASIRKRDGSQVPFDPKRIERAIALAGQATNEFDEQEARRLARRVLVIATAGGMEHPTVESIQDIVEEVLIASPHRRSARAYIVYREQHRTLREIRNAYQTGLVDTYLNKTDWQVSENANMAFSL